MTTPSDLKTMASHPTPNKYRMVVESTSIDVIRDALPMYRNAIIVETHHGLMLAVPEPENNSGIALDF